MSTMDFNTAGPARMMGELIPHNTPAMLVLTVRPGGRGADESDGGWLKASNDGNCLMIDAEFTVDGGPHAKRKFWGTMVVKAATDRTLTEGQQTAVSISMGHLRAILESARGILPGDASDAAQAGRRISSWGDLNGLRFPARIAIEKGKLIPSGGGTKYDDKNILGCAITPDDRDYVSPGPQQPVAASVAVFASAANQGGAAAAPAVAKPAWAS
jgi:hypothetical protein